MLNPNPAVKAALVADAALIAKLGGNKIYNAYPGIEIEEPYVIFEEENNMPAFGADDVEKASEITIAITVVAADKTTLAAILLEVDRIMVSLGYVRERIGPLLQLDVNLSRLMRFKTEMEVT